MKSEHTKQLFADALKFHLEIKTINRVTIKDITSHCGMNRQSFYYHFNDIYDLLKWIFITEATPTFHNKKGTLLWEEGIPMLMSYMHDNKKLCLNGYLAAIDSPFLDFLYDDILHLVRETIDELSVGLLFPEKEKDQLAQYYVLSFSSLMEGWLKGLLTQSPEEISAFFNQIIYDHMMGVMKRMGVEPNM